MIVRICSDAGFIDRVFRELFEQITVDGYDEAPSGQACLDSKQLLFLEVEDRGERHGLFMFHGTEVHTMLLPSLRGARAVVAARAVLSWIWTNTSFPEVTSYSYSNAPHVKFFALRVGLQEVGTLDEGVTIKGKPVLTTRLSISRPIF